MTTENKTDKVLKAIAQVIAEFAWLLIACCKAAKTLFKLAACAALMLVPSACEALMDYCLDLNRAPKEERCK